MDGQTVSATAQAASDLPTWGAYALAGLGVLVGIFLTFFLGIVANLLGSGKRSNDKRSPVVEGFDEHCANCTQIGTVKDRLEDACRAINDLRKGLDALNGRIDRLLEIRAGGHT